MLTDSPEFSTNKDSKKLSLGTFRSIEDMSLGTRMATNPPLFAHVFDELDFEKIVCFGHKKVSG